MSSIDRLRRQAKSLKRAFNAGDEAAIRRVREYLPDTETLKHTGALHVVAREEGFESWPKLKLAFETSAMDRYARAERLKLALYNGQSWAVEHLLNVDPALATHNFGLQCAIYDVEGVRAVLSADPLAATRAVDIRSPILHLAFSKHFQAHPERQSAALEIAEMLVANGANVNDSYPAEPGSEHGLSALYGALGHAGNIRLAEWLLEKGANPDDNESLYHAAELPRLDGLRLLLRYNVITLGTNALLRMLDFDNYEGAELLLEYGADPNEFGHNHPSGERIEVIPALHHAARRGRGGRFADLLLKYGADPHALWQGHTAYSLAMVYGNFSFAKALERVGHASALTEKIRVFADCARGITPKDKPLEGISLTPEESLVLTRIILNEDALDHAKALAKAGLDPNMPDEMGMTPLQLAAWAGLPRQTRWLLTLDPDLKHVNGFGGSLIGSIIHGSENSLDVQTRNHVDCLHLALNAGAPVSIREVNGALDEDIAAALQEWAEAHPDRVEDG